MLRFEGCEGSRPHVRPGREHRHLRNARAYFSVRVFRFSRLPTSLGHPVDLIGELEGPPRSEASEPRRRSSRVSGRWASLRATTSITDGATPVRTLLSRSVRRARSHRTREARSSHRSHVSCVHGLSSQVRKTSHRVAFRLEALKLLGAPARRDPALATDTSLERLGLHAMSRCSWSLRPATDREKAGARLARSVRLLGGPSSVQRPRFPTRRRRLTRPTSSSRSSGPRQASSRRGTTRVAEATSRPAVLLVETPVGSRAGLRCHDERLQEGGQGSGRLDPGRLVGHAKLEGSVARVRTNVPPDPCVGVGEAEGDEVRRKTFPVSIRREDGGAPARGKRP